MDANVKLEGPIFGGGWNTRVDELMADLTETSGEVAKDLVLRNLDASLRNPTGAYRSRVTVDATRSFARVHDNRAVYGPWLEGTSSRNARTRFKGYANWRRATQEMERQVTRVGDEVVRQHIGKMGG